ncbi:hypothetical protein GCM10023169_35220 [Georgenia halophila]|uniref:SnoaL-like domain-containing protein n=1 Tax=Georgenia halophila TaxID=620889 RepID=A0ABP8LLI2_9MICO
MGSVDDGAHASARDGLPSRGERRPAADDRLAIEELFSRYAWGVDTGDVSAVAELFVEEAVIEDTVAGKLFRPPHAGRDFARYFRGRAVFPGRQHWVGQALMTMTGVDTCRVRSFGMASHLYATGANYLTYLGSYDDQVVRTSAGWRFRERRYGSWQRDTFAGYSAVAKEGSA